MACPSWPFRMGKNPWRAPPTEAQIEARRQAGLRLRGSADSTSLIGANDDHEATDTGIRDRDHDFREDESELPQPPAAIADEEGC